MSLVDITLDFSESDLDKEELEGLTLALYNQLDSLDEADVDRVREVSAEATTKGDDEGKPKSGWLSVVFDAVKSSKILKTIAARLLGKQVKFKLKRRGKEIEFESQSFSQEEVEDLVNLLKEL